MDSMHWEIPRSFSLISYPSPIITQSSFLAHKHNGHPGRAWFKLEELSNGTLFTKVPQEFDRGNGK